MAVLKSQLAADGPTPIDNRQAHLDLIHGFRTLEQKVRDASARAEARMRERGQLLPRERLDQLLDRDTPFLELSTLAGLGMHEDDGAENAYGGGVVCGIGFVSGIRCAVLVNDSGIKAGASHPKGVEKILRLQAIALENRLPFIQLVESAGANLLLQSEMFVMGGGLFANLARLSAAGLPVISVVHGSSTAGGAYQTGLADYVILVRGRSRVFLAGPPLLKAATGEVAGEEALGGADMHAGTTGLGEFVAEDDADALRIARELLAKIKWDRGGGPGAGFAEPLHPIEQLLDLVPADYRKPYDVRGVIARIVDGSDFLDFKPDWGGGMVCGYAAIEGRPVGLIGNNGPIDSAGAAKTAQFVQLCCQTGTPLVFLQNTTGFIVGVEAERSGIVKHGSKMIQAITNAAVPKITIQIGAAFGAGYYAMCGRAFGPRFVFAWPNSRIAVMGGEQAAKVMTIIAEDRAERAGKEPDRARLDAQAKQVIDAYARESTALYATARLWDDGIIDPRDTRRVLAFCLATAAEGDARVLRPNPFGVARM